MCWFCHTLTWIRHECNVFPIPNPPSHLPPHPIPLGHPSAPALSTCIMHQTWTGDSFHIWYFTCFMLHAILPYHPTLVLSHKVQKTVQYICVSFAVQTDSLLSVPPWNQSPSLLPSPHFLFFQALFPYPSQFTYPAIKNPLFQLTLFHFLPFSLLCLK